MGTHVWNVTDLLKRIQVIHRHMRDLRTRPAPGDVKPAPVNIDIGVIEAAVASAGFYGLQHAIRATAFALLRGRGRRSGKNERNGTSQGKSLHVLLPEIPARPAHRLFSNLKNRE